MKHFLHLVCGRRLSLCRLRLKVGVVAASAMFMLAAPFLFSQAAAGASAAPIGSAGKVAAITSLRIVQEKDGPAVEILSTKPLAPSIKALGDPPRLVIDLPNARVDGQKRISVEADQITALRANQFQQNPPIVRVVVDLQAPREYRSEAAGNRLVVHLGKSPSQASGSPFQAPTVPSLTSAPAPAVASVRAPGPLTLAESAAGSGSAITAATETAVINLSSGGEVRVCPGTTVSLTASQNRHNVMLSMNTGALETHLRLDASSDSVVTPDFRIVLTGPGEFDYAISADSQGNTCMRALPGNTASAVVSELIGDRSYQVKATDQLVFRLGQLDRVDMAVPLECGCPPVRDIPSRANSVPSQSEISNKSQSRTLPVVSTNPAPTAEAASSETLPAGNTDINRTNPLNASPPPNELKVQVEAPLVFKATGPAPPPVEDVRTLPLASRPRTIALALAPALPPRTAEGSSETTGVSPAPAGGFFHKIGRFFASLFR